MWHGTIQGQIRVFDYSLPIDCRVYSLRPDQSCGFYGLIEGAYHTMLDPQFLTLQQSIDLSRPTFMKGLKRLSNLYEEDCLECPLTRLEICKFMLKKCEEQAGIYSNLWTIHPVSSVLDKGTKVATAAGIVIASENLGKGEMWGLAVLDPSTQLDEGYLRVLVDYLDSAVAFSFIVKRHLHSNSRRVTRSRVAMEAEEPAHEFVHLDIHDIKGDGNKALLAVWILHLKMSPCSDDPYNLKNHFELMSCVVESDDRSPVIFLDPHMECVESGHGRHSYGDVGGSGPSGDHNSDDHRDDQDGKSSDGSNSRDPSLNMNSTPFLGRVSDGHSQLNCALGTRWKMIDLTLMSPNKVQTCLLPLLLP